MDNINFVQPKNWASFQHYKDRSPTWIKLHKSLLDNYDYQCLQLASKALAPMLWLLASEYDDAKIPYDLERLAFRLRVDKEIVQSALSDLIQRGFFVCYQGASEVLADCLPREEKRREEKSIVGKPPKSQHSKELKAERFDEFWVIYPRKVSKLEAQNAWSKNNCDAIADEVISGAKRLADAKKGDDPKFTPHASTWLNGNRWNDGGDNSPDDGMGVYV